MIYIWINKLFSIYWCYVANKVTRSSDYYLDLDRARDCLDEQILSMMRDALKSELIPDRDIQNLFDVHKSNVYVIMDK